MSSRLVLLKASSVVASILALLIAIAPANAGILSVDFGATGQTVQTDFEGFTEATGSPSEMNSYSTSLGTIGVTVSSDADSGLGFRWRNNAVTGTYSSISDLLRGEVKSKHDWSDETPQGVERTLTLQLSGLPTGTYKMTTYHHGAGSDTTDPGTFDLYVDSSKRNSTPYVQTKGYTSPSDVLMVDFWITADGTNPVTIDFVEANTTSNEEVILNGFELSVPEPSGLILLAFGAVALLLWRRK